MWVVFRKSDKQVLGSTIDTGIERSKDEALKEVARGLAGKANLDELDAVEVKDSTSFGNLTRAVATGQARVRDLAGGKVDVVDDVPESTTVQISTNAQQFHPVDGVPLIPGDGQSFLVVTLQKVNQQGQAVGRKTVDNEVIWLRTSHGTLRSNEDERGLEIRSVKLVSGTASFRLQSESAKRLATVQMLSANPDLRLGGLQVEFI